jgi:hypothetical protein
MYIYTFEKGEKGVREKEKEKTLPPRLGRFRPTPTTPLSLVPSLPRLNFGPITARRPPTLTLTLSHWQLGPTRQPLSLSLSFHR